MKDRKCLSRLFPAAPVCLFGLWHLLDVKSGAEASGDTWLLWLYLGLFLFGMIFLLLVGCQGAVRRKWKTEQYFAAAALGLGILFSLVLPPLSAPDEVSHYISAYQLSNRMMGREGASEEMLIPIRGEDCIIEDMEDVLADDGSGYRAEEEEEKTPVILGQELTEETYRSIYQGGLSGAGTGETGFSYQPAVRTTPLAYVPQAIGITLARLAGLPAIGLLYMGRLMNLLFFVVMGYLAIRRMPFGKEVLFGVYMLPMTLHLASSFSYDVMIISCSGYFMAICLDLAYRAEKVRARDVLVLALIMAVMGPCKMVYGVIAGYCLLIPVKKFGGFGKWLLAAAAVLGAFAAAMVLVNSRNVAMYTQASEGYIAWAEEAGYTFSGLLHSPLLVLRMCYNTLMWQGEELYSGMIGASLGNLDPVLNTPYPVVLALTAILVMLALKKPGESMKIGMGGRAWIWVLSFLCLGALMFSMLLAWTPVTATTIQGVQGRYLLPLLPMLLLTCKNDRVVRTGWGDEYLLYLMIAMDVYVIFRIFAVVCLRV